MTDSQSPGRAAASATREATARPRSSGLRRFLPRILALSMLVVFLGFLALGTWQVKRLFWKLDLIERVDRRVHAAPVAAPGPAIWPSITADSHEYLHVHTAGTYLYSQTARVQAVTIYGSGYWLLTPLRAADGTIILINRGYIATGAHDVKEGASDGPAEVSGLLRISERGGGFLRHNDPAADRWFSRDVQAIADVRKLSNVAPYFVDVDAASNGSAQQDGRATARAAGEPIGGLTVIAFPNNHLVYALTWYGLALMTAGAGFWVMRDEKRRRAARSDQESNNGKQG
nr:SURF1 family protein [Herbaspirillum sp. meg3]